MSAAPILTILKDGEKVRSQTIEGEVSLGRAEGNVIRLDDRAISRQHAILRPVKDGVQIEKRSDFGKIELNGVDCTSAVVRMGDVLSIGPYLIQMETSPEQKVEQKPEQKADHEPILRSVPPLIEEAPSPIVDLSSPAPVETPTLVTPIEPESVTGSFVLGGSQELAPSDALPLEDLSSQPGESAAEVGALGSIFDGLGQPSQAGNTPLEVGLDDATVSLMDSSSSSSSSDPIGEDDQTRAQSLPIEAKLILISGNASPTELGISKSEISIGRGKSCDIVLDDKKVSRKNTVIVRDGQRYILRDLGSSNGTYLNGKPIKEKALSSEDRIRVGDCEFSFVALNPMFDQLPMQLEEEAEPSLATPLRPDFGGTRLNAPLVSASTQQIHYTPGAVPGMLAATSPEKKGIFKIYDRYIRNFGTLKPVQKLLVVLVLGYGAILFMEEEEPTNGASAQKVAAQQAVKVPKGMANLTPEQRKYVDTQYNLAFDLYTKKEYEKAHFELKGIFRYVPQHAQARELERYILEAKRILEAKEAEKKRKEEEERLQARIAALKVEIQDLMKQGEYVQAKERFAEILEIDPEDAQVGEWRAQIDAFFEEQERIAQEKRVQEEINRAARETFKEAEALHGESHYHDAIRAYQRVGEMGSSEKSLIQKAGARIQACKDAIRDLREPVLAQARTLEQSGDLGGAFREYEKATRIDPPHAEGYAGMDRIREALNLQSKTLYTEALVAESYSDFKLAYRKFKEILGVAPVGSLYYERAMRKIAHYHHFQPEEEATSDGGNP